MKRSQTARTSPGVSGPFQLRGVGKWRSRVAGSSRCSSVVHKTGKSATISTRSKRGSVVFIHPFYPPPPFPKTTPNTSEPAARNPPPSIGVAEELAADRELVQVGVRPAHRRLD